MNQKDEFYIGWSEETPKRYRKAGWLFFLTTALLLLGFVLLFARSQVGFVDSYFDYGNLTQVRGQLTSEPIPALLTLDSGGVKTIPLVGFGKFGAGPVMTEFKEVLGDLSEYEVVIQGTMFQYQGKHWMELTEGKESLIEHHKRPNIKRNISDKGTIRLSGEIVDPKCFFE